MSKVDGCLLWIMLSVCDAADRVACIAFEVYVLSFLESTDKTAQRTQNPAAQHGTAQAQRGSPPSIPRGAPLKRTEEDVSCSRAWRHLLFWVQKNAKRTHASQSMGACYAGMLPGQLSHALA